MKPVDSRFGSPYEYGRQEEPRKRKHYNSLHGLRRIYLKEIESIMESLKLHGRAVVSISGAIHYMNIALHPFSRAERNLLMVHGACTDEFWMHFWMI